MAALQSGHIPRGRARECETLDRLLDGMHTHRSQVLVLCGEAGIGKTTLLDYVDARASGCIESEMELSFAEPVADGRDPGTVRRIVLSTSPSRRSP